MECELCDLKQEKIEMLYSHILHCEREIHKLKSELGHYKKKELKSKEDNIEEP